VTGEAEASSTRLAKFAPDDLDAEQRALYEEIAGGPRATGPQVFRLRDDRGGLEGPFNAFLLQPSLGRPLQALGAAVRYRTSLTDRAREIAILVVAAVEDSAFERYAHEAVGIAAGLTESELAGIRRLSFDGLPAPDRQVAGLTLALIRTGDLPDAKFADAEAALGRSGVFELTTLVGYYRTLALQLRVFRVPTPES
jgi:4-carboxymuconolactone decarboxylase